MIRVSHHAKPLLVPPPRAPIRTSSLSAAAAAAECDLIANGKRSVAGTGRVVCHARRTAVVAPPPVHSARALAAARPPAMFRKPSLLCAAATATTTPQLQSAFWPPAGALHLLLPSVTDFTAKRPPKMPNF